MKIFNMERGTGKTTLLIIMSHFTNARIITATESSAGFVENKAKEMKLSIPTPICWSYYVTSYGRGRKEKILIDDADYVLKNIFFGHDILATTTSEEIIK